MNRVLLVEDHAAFREPLSFMFDREPDFEVVAQAGSIFEANQMLEDIDLAVVDRQMPEMDGMEQHSDQPSVWDPHQSDTPTMFV